MFGWSGMRQEVYRHHAGRPGYRLVTRSASYITDMATAKFCLAPTGGGHGKRQVHRGGDISTCTKSFS